MCFTLRDSDLKSRILKLANHRINIFDGTVMRYVTDFLGDQFERYIKAGVKKNVDPSTIKKKITIIHS